MPRGWAALIAVANGSDFREFVIFYHEAGDETFRLLDRKGDMLPQRDAHTDTYRPAARLLNYRSEPHGERLEMQEHLIGFADESQGYGSYTFGDPATTIPRSYLGDPAKFRMVGGSEIVHSHHLHGGSIRWARRRRDGAHSGRCWRSGSPARSSPGTTGTCPGSTTRPSRAT